MKQQDTGAAIATAVIGLLLVGLVIGVVIVFQLLPATGRTLRAMTIAGRVPVARLLRRITGGWPAEEAINTQPTACFLALILWSFVGVLIGGVLVYLGAPLMSLFIGFCAGLVTGALCSLGREPQPHRQQTLTDIYPPGWHL
jgi:uncharacterized membrane protein required for colicin V production